MAEIVRKTTSHAWKETLKFILENGRDYNDGTSDFRQVLNLNVEIMEPEDDIIAPIKVLSDSDRWIYPSLEEIRSIILSKKKNPSYKFTYGQRLFDFNKEMNQLDDYVIPLLKKDKHTRRGVLNLWNPLVDGQVDPHIKPGLLMCTLKVVDNKLRLTAVIRNNDFFIGWPATLYQLYVIQDYIASKIDVEKGAIITYSPTAHIYKDHIEEIKKLLK